MAVNLTLCEIFDGSFSAVNGNNSSKEIEMFMVVEYTYFKSDENNAPKVMHRLFDMTDADSLDDAQQFCKEVNENGGAVNIRNRNINPETFQ